MPLCKLGLTSLNDSIICPVFSVFVNDSIICPVFSVFVTSGRFLLAIVVAVLNDTCS